jgi:hypothetical protein
MNPYLYLTHSYKKKLWLPKGIRPVMTVTGSHQRTCVFGTLTLKGKQLFCQYDKFNQDTFLDYLKQINKKLGKVVMFTDRARQHQSNLLKLEEFIIRIGWLFYDRSQTRYDKILFLFKFLDK